MPAETLIEAAKKLGEALTQAACNNPVYPTLTAFSGLQQLADIMNKADDTMESPRVEKPKTNEGTPLRVGEAPPDPAPLRVRDPIYGKTLQPTTHRYPTRARALNMLLYGKPEPPAPPPDGLPAYLLNAIINEETGEVRADAL